MRKLTLTLAVSYANAMEAALRAVAEPHRRTILRLVRDRELTAGEIADRFDVTRPAISQHLRVLREAGLVAVRRDGTRRYYRADPDGLAGIRRVLEELWDARLDGLRRAAEHQARRRPRRRT